MYDFILQTVFMLSLGTLIYLISRSVPRVTEINQSHPKRDYFGELMEKIPLEKVDAFISANLEKFLRKLKVVIMKLDNLVTKHLKSVRPAAGGEENKEKPSLFEKKENNS